MLKSTLTVLICSASFAQAVITTSNNAAVGLKAGPAGSVLETTDAPIGSKLLFVVSTADTSFSNVLNGDSLTVGSFLGASDDLILAIGEAVDFGGGPGNVGGQLNLDNYAFANGASEGDNYALYWFTELTSANNSASTGNVYGIARGANWQLPADNATHAGDNLFGTPLTANFTVNAVPEPSSTALLGLGALALIGRRQRR